MVVLWLALPEVWMRTELLAGGYGRLRGQRHGDGQAGDGGESGWRGEAHASETCSAEGGHGFERVLSDKLIADCVIAKIRVQDMPVCVTVRVASDSK